jgi:predicted phosphodiesterase
MAPVWVTPNGSVSLPPLADPARRRAGPGAATRTPVPPGPMSTRNGDRGGRCAAAGGAGSGGCRRPPASALSARPTSLILGETSPGRVGELGSADMPNKLNPRSAPPAGEPTTIRAAARVAVLSDVHANVPALTAVLADVAGSDVDLVVITGDLTWGPEPERTLELVGQLGHTVCVRGNCDRMVVELASEGTANGEPADELGSWLARQHPPESVSVLAGFPFSAAVAVEELGTVRFCHGSTRSDEEILTSITPPDRLDAVFSRCGQRILVHGHTHIQYDRVVGARRVLNAGSVGLPCHDGPPGTAYWAVLGPDVELRQTSYDVDEAVRRCEAVGYPEAARFTGLLRQPRSPAQVVPQAEPMVFSG